MIGGWFPRALPHTASATPAKPLIIES